MQYFRGGLAQSSYYYSEIRCIALCVLPTSKELRLFVFRQSSYRKHMFTWTSSKGHCLWFVIGGFRSVLFVSSWFQGSLLCDSPVSGNNRLVKFASQIFLVFLILVTCKNKATSASFLRKKIHSPSRFPSPFDSWAV